MFALFFFFIALACAYPNRCPCVGDCWAHDPSMIQRRADGKYFRFSTGTGVSTMISDSLKGPWKDLGSALPDGSKIHLDGVGSKNIWAPDVHFQNDQYYMYYVLSKTGTQHSEIGVATSKTMEPGSWTDHGVIGLPYDDAYNRIDPNWIMIDGKNYLNFGSYWNDIYQVEMESPLHVGSAIPRQLSFNETLNHREEGSFMFKHDDYYYLLYSGGIAGRYTATYPEEGEEYRISVCRSQSGTGGFVDQNGVSCLQTGGTLLLSSHGEVYGPGGLGVLFDQHIGPVLYYHYYPLAEKQSGGDAGNAGYKHGWNQLGFENGWPYVKASR